jgi:hypothetical protein
MPNKYIPLGKRIVWEGYKTPVNDANLNNIESRIQNISDYLEYIQQAGMVIGRGVIIGDDSKPINDMTYLVLRERDIDVAHFSFDDITFFHNTSTNAADTYKPLLHIHRNNSNNSNNSFMTFDGEYRVTKGIGIGNSDEEAIFLYRNDLMRLKTLPIYTSDTLPKEPPSNYFLMKDDETSIFVSSLPLEKGISENTVQQKGNITTGGKAFKFSKIDAVNKKFTLVHADGSNVSVDDVGYEVGDEYSFTFVHKYDTAQGDSVTYSANVKADMIGKITNIQQETNGSVTVTVDTLHYTVKGNAIIAENYQDGCLFIVPSKPEIGDVPIGEYATTLGVDNINVARAGFVSGEGHINSGQYVLMGGKFNVGGYCGLIGGRENFVPANYGTAGGSNHIITGNRGTGFGGQQKVYSEYGFGGNRNNTVEAYAGTAFGDTNQVKAGATNGFIGGGTGNEITKPNGFIAGGTGNKMYSWRGFTAGEGNTNDTGSNNGSMGLNNVVQSHMGFAGGQKTKVTTAELAGEGSGSGYASFGWGNNLLITGGGSLGGGAWNKILADYGVVGGFTNQIKHKFCAIFGQNNYTTAENQLITGKWAKPSSNALFTIGNGASDTARANAFEVIEINGVAYLRLNNTNICAKDNSFYIYGCSAEDYGVSFGASSKSAIGALSFGEQGKALGYCSFSGGKKTITKEQFQTALGKFNADNANALFMVGNGTSENDRSNAFEVLKDGTMISKKLKIGNTEITEEQLKNILTLI